MIPGLFAGELQEMVGYRTFFILVMIFCSVTFITASLLKIDPNFGKKEQ
jgi:PAT family beta-lactamase induction signal transducer AmpG